MNRIVQSVATLWVIATIVFFLSKMIPGGPYDLEKPPPPDGRTSPHVGAPAEKITAPGQHNRRRGGTPDLGGVADSGSRNLLADEDLWLGKTCNHRPEGDRHIFPRSWVEVGWNLCGRDWGGGRENEPVPGAMAVGGGVGSCAGPVRGAGLGVGC